MFALRCDRCGEFYIPSVGNDRNRMEFYYHSYRSNTSDKGCPYDLCPECSKELADWICEAYIEEQS